MITLSTINIALRHHREGKLSLSQTIALIEDMAADEGQLDEVQEILHLLKLQRPMQAVPGDVISVEEAGNE